MHALSKLAPRTGGCLEKRFLDGYMAMQSAGVFLVPADCIISPPFDLRVVREYPVQICSVIAHLLRLLHQQHSKSNHQGEQ